MPLARKALSRLRFTTQAPALITLRLGLLSGMGEATTVSSTSALSMGVSPMLTDLYLLLACGLLAVAAVLTLMEARG